MTEKATQIARILAAKDSSFYRTVREPRQKSVKASIAAKPVKKVQKKESQSVFQT